MATYNERGRLKYIDSSSNTYNLYHPLERAPALQGGDLNDAPANTLYVLTTDYSYSNLPDDRSAGNGSWLFTYGTTASTGARLQILYVPVSSNKMYMRRRASESSGWRDWTDITAMTEVTSAPTTSTDSGTALSAQTYARYGMHYGVYIDGTWYGYVHTAGYTSLDDLPGNTLMVCSSGNGVENMPEETTGWVFTIGSYSTAARFQIYFTYTASGVYIRHYSPNNGWYSWTNMMTPDRVSPAKMYSIGNSLLTGSVWVNDKYDHLVSYGYSPYGCIANAVNIAEENESHTLLSSTGILHNTGNSNFRDTILAADLSEYDILVTHAWYADMVSSFSFGGIDSTDSSTLCGAIRAIVDHCRQQNPAMHVVIISPQVVSTTDQASDAPFDYQFGNGYTRREIDEMLHEMADKYRFIYVDWQDYDPAYHWKDFVDTSNVHACKDRYYLGMGGYLGGRISAEVRF